MKLKLISLFIFYFLNVTMRKLKIISVAYILVCSILLWDSPSQPNETSACCLAVLCVLGTDMKEVDAL